MAQKVTPTKLEAEGEWEYFGTADKILGTLGLDPTQLNGFQRGRILKLLQTATQKARRQCAEEIINHLTETREQFERSSIDGLMSVLTLEGIIKGLRHRYLDGENSQPNA